MDATTEAQIRLGLREAMKGRTTIIIAHRLSTIALADELVVLDDGRIAARGTHDELLETSAVYREIYEHGLLEREFVEPSVEARRPHEGLAAGQPPDAAARRRGRRLVVAARPAPASTTLARLDAPYKLRTALALVSLLGGDGDRARAAATSRSIAVDDGIERGRPAARSSIVVSRSSSRAS